MSLCCWLSSHGRPLLLRLYGCYQHLVALRSKVLNHNIFLMLISAYNQYCCTQTEERRCITVNMERFLVFSSHCNVFFCCCLLPSNLSSPPTPFHFSHLLSSVHHSLRTSQLCPAGSHCVVSHLTCWNVGVMWGTCSLWRCWLTLALETDWQAKRGRH